MSKLRTFLHNITFLSSHKIEDEFRELQYETILNIEEYCKFELNENLLNKSQTLNILNYEETLVKLTNEPKSFCRIGDGEINLINGKSISFQEYDPYLAKILLQILEDESTDFYVGINYNYFHSTQKLSTYNRKFYLLDIREYRKFLLDHCNNKRTYIAAAFNQLYMFYDNYDFDDYYKKIKMLFSDRELVIFAGKGILQNLKFDIFDMCKSKELIEAPSENAFSEFDVILEKARTFDKKKTLCFILGPASKALVYYLTKEGFMAWDIGHMAKDYNMYMNNIEKNPTTTDAFYSKD